MAEVEQVDRISNLSDALLSKILSFLLTKEAVATSILSKRWESVWTKVPVLNFATSFSPVNGFKAFVDKVLICNDSPSLRLFKLYVSSREVLSKDFHYHSWIRNIMRRDVVEIDLILFRGTLPAGILSSETLMVLKLSNFASFRLRDPVHLPNLLTLHFNYIEFASIDYSFEDLLMSLPRLEELVVWYCKGLQDICIFSSSLKRLELVDFTIYQRDTKKNTIVDAPSLEYLRINDFSSYYTFCNIHSLAEASLHAQYYKDCWDVRMMINLLTQVSNFKILKLDITPLKNATLEELDQVPLFPNLTHLIVECVLRFTEGSNFSWRYLILWILQRAPHIVSLDYFVMKAYSLHEEDDLTWPPTSLTKCPIPTLEVVNIYLSNPANADKILLGYLLNNAINLKVFTINLTASVVNERTINAIAWLFEVPRASSVCKIVISHQK